MFNKQLTIKHLFLSLLLTINSLPGTAAVATEESNDLDTSFDSETEESNDLDTSFDSKTEESNDLDTSFDSKTEESNDLDTSFDFKAEESNDLDTGFHFETEERIDYRTLDLYPLKVERWMKGRTFFRQQLTVITAGLPYESPRMGFVKHFPLSLDNITHLWVFKPSISVSAMTAVEVEPGSDWRITNYQINHGSAVTMEEFDTIPYYSNNLLPKAVLYHQPFFDPSYSDAAARYVILDQEDWWGVKSFPLDADITFSRTNPETSAEESIVVNVKRKVTNALKTGKIKLAIKTEEGSEPVEYKLQSQVRYPKTNFSSWYHEPANVLVDFEKSDSNLGTNQ